MASDKREAHEWTEFFPGTMWHDVREGVQWRLHKHWAANVYAGEGLATMPGSDDRSGCLLEGFVISPNGRFQTPMKLCMRPMVVEQRIYQKGERQISAVFSYPGGLSIHLDYFWEIYPVKEGVERFDSEEEMEARVVHLLREREEVTHGPG